MWSLLLCSRARPLRRGYTLVSFLAQRVHTALVPFFIDAITVVRFDLSHFFLKYSTVSLSLPGLTCFSLLLCRLSMRLKYLAARLDSPELTLGIQSTVSKFSWTRILSFFLYSVKPGLLIKFYIFPRWTENRRANRDHVWPLYSTHQVRKGLAPWVYRSGKSEIFGFWESDF